MEYNVILDPDVVVGKINMPKDIVLWCVNNFGPVGDSWDWTINSKRCLEFRFKNKSDIVQFTLAWC